MKKVLLFAGLLTFIGTQMLCSCSGDDDTHENVFNRKDTQNSTYAFVDLGLTSGNKWASKNAGAASESDFGMYYSYSAIPDSLNLKAGASTGGTVEFSAKEASFVIKKDIDLSKLNGMTISYSGLENVRVKAVYAQDVDTTDMTLNTVIYYDLDETKSSATIAFTDTLGEKIESLALQSTAEDAKVTFEKIALTKTEEDKVTSSQTVTSFKSSGTGYAYTKTPTSTDSWSIPTIDDMKELIEECVWRWENKGYRVTSKTNGNSIYLPAAGYIWEKKLYGVGEKKEDKQSGYIWSCTADTVSGKTMGYLSFYNDSVIYCNYGEKDYGLNVRFVQHK